MDEYDLTPRQKEILEHLCKGHSNKVIARNLGIAEATVKLHLTDIFKTMGVTTRYQALAIACNLPITVMEPLPDLTDLDILKEFANVVFDGHNLKGSEKITMLGHLLKNRTVNQTV